MTQTFIECIDTLRLLLSDPKDQKWTKAHKQKFLNRALTDIVSSEAVPYVRTMDIPIRDNEYEYEFPEDMLEPLAMMLQDIEGDIIVSSSWKSLVGDIESGNTVIPDNVFWDTANRASGHVTLRDIVSDNKFLFTPKYQSDLHSGTVVTSEDLPSSASEGDLWVDSYESENYVYLCNEGYNAAAEQANGVLLAGSLPSGVNLVFTYDVPGIKYVQIVVVDGGPTGAVSDPVITGNADDRSNPLTYTYTIYDDTSNDTIIALTATDMTVTGSSAVTTGSVTDTSLDLENPADDRWTQQVIHFRYNAIFPKLVNDDDPLPSELPVLIREGDCLAYIAASKMLDTVKGDERMIIMSRQFKKEYENILERVHEHRMNSGPPYDLEPA